MTMRVPVGDTYHFVSVIGRFGLKHTISIQVAYSCLILDFCLLLLKRTPVNKGRLFQFVSFPLCSVCETTVAQQKKT